MVCCLFIVGGSKALNNKVIRRILRRTRRSLPPAPSPVTLDPCAVPVLDLLKTARAATTQTRLLRDLVYPARVVL
jgi:hypothetical protein